MSHHRFSRRQFLEIVGLSTVTLAAGSSIQAADGRRPAPWQQQQPETAAAPTRADVLAQIRRNLQEKFAGKEMGLDFRRLNATGELDFSLTFNAQELYPVASAFKAFVVLYYFLYTPVDQWEYTPGSHVYRVAVYSNNSLTGNLIHNTAPFAPFEGNSIEKYNDFLVQVLGMKEGLYTWYWVGNTPTNGVLDERFTPRRERLVRVREQSEFVGNVSSATDLAIGWQFIATAENDPRWQEDQFRRAIEATRQLLSIPSARYRSPIERVLFGGYTGKDGTLQVGDLDVGRVINDAGLVRVLDGQYIVSFMSAGESEESTDPALSEVIDSIRTYQDFVNPFRAITIAGTSAPVVPGQFNYGFVRSSNNVQLYLEPDSQAAKVDNPTRRTSTFGTPYVMRGALLRFEPVNDQWGRIVWDDPTDDVFTYTDYSFVFTEANWANWNKYTRPSIYVPLDTLKIIDKSHTEPIEYVSAVDEPVDKFIILYVPRRQLTLFEGTTPILKTPIVLNSLMTPRGRLYVNRIMVARNMPRYPGVPYASFLHDGAALNQIGYAVHGAPWQLWNETVTEWETIRRYSAGCINIPGWSWPVGNYELPVDEFIFRWINGFPEEDYKTQRSYFMRNRVHVLSFNNPYEEIFQYSILDTMRRQGLNWNDILRRWEAKAVDAPPQFFQNPYTRNGDPLLNLDAATGTEDDGQ
ncbi:MAG: L,D-transpeptidase [Anaerolineae bacterium]|nr:L,D-transpeptidase [Anaerolineae bacterium]